MSWSNRTLFKKSDFTSHSGIPLSWKMTPRWPHPEDWAAIASFVGPRLRFRSVHGIPRGGVAFAEALKPYAVEEGGSA